MAWMKGLFVLFIVLRRTLLVRTNSPCARVFFFVPHYPQRWAAFIRSFFCLDGFVVFFLFVYSLFLVIFVRALSHPTRPCELLLRSVPFFDNKLPIEYYLRFNFLWWCIRRAVSKRHRRDERLYYKPGKSSRWNSSLVLCALMNERRTNTQTNE